MMKIMLSLGFTLLEELKLLPFFFLFGFEFKRNSSVCITKELFEEFKKKYISLD